ncbi:epoxide hydrolase [Xylariomycetidae sp. FL2044]|nr:epoxide hydrolase [Xylariomycetidae sp. FL2044]
MESFHRKTLTTSRGFTLSYHVSAGNGARPTLLLLHGFPDDASLWDELAPRLAGYPLIVPDLLGYANTSKPTDPAAYNYVGHTGDLVEILDAESVEKAVCVGHDIGSILASRLYRYTHHPDRVGGLILLAPGYMLPRSGPPDLEKTSAWLESLWGYPAFAYQEFFVWSEEAPALLRANADRFYQSMHGAPRGWVKDVWCRRGQLATWLRDRERTVELRDYARDPRRRQGFVDRVERDGLEGPLCYLLQGDVLRRAVRHHLQRLGPGPLRRAGAAGLSHQGDGGSYV